MRSKSSAAKPAPKPRIAAKLGNQVRIIGGQWKRTKLKVVDAAGLRPTPDRVRETLFNWLGQDLQGLRCMDAFAGSGALGFEAASRGAVNVLVVEQDPALVEQMPINEWSYKIDKAKWQAVIDMMVENGLLEKPHKADEYISDLAKPFVVP